MKTSNAKQKFNSDDPVWILLADLSLGDFLPDQHRREESTAGYLLQMVRELGLPLECVENIAMLVSEVAKESPVHDKPERLEFSGRIRIFCQKKIIDDANAWHASSRPCPTEQAMELLPVILDFGTKMNGGWGCFLIRRGANVSDDASLSSPHVVDLYLYREG
jgi:hypothetical protein